MTDHGTSQFPAPAAPLDQGPPPGRGGAVTSPLFGAHSQSRTPCV